MSFAEIPVAEYEKSIDQKAIANRIPWMAMFELTYKCNFDCVMCYNAPQDKKELATEQIFFILDELASSNCFHLTFTGGEPMIRKDIFDILDHAVQKGFRINLKSNASLLTPERIDRLEALGIVRLDVSFHGKDAEAFEEVTQVRGSYERTKRVVEELTRRRFDLSLNMVVMKSNLDQITELRQFARSLGVRFSYNMEVSPKANQDKGPLNYRISPRLMKFTGAKQMPIDPKKKLELYLMRLKGSNSRKGLFTCGVGKSQIVVSPYGEARLCLDIEEPSFSILEFGLREAWQKLVAFVEKTDVRLWQCPEALRPFCLGWCPARGLLETGSLYGCDDHCQTLARLNQEEYEGLLARARKEGWFPSMEATVIPEKGCEFENHF